MAGHRYRTPAIVVASVLGLAFAGTLVGHHDDPKPASPECVAALARAVDWPGTSVPIILQARVDTYCPEQLADRARR